MDAVRLLHGDLEQIRRLGAEFNPAALPLTQVRARLIRLGERLESHLAVEESLLTLMRISAMDAWDRALVERADRAVSHTRASLCALMSPYVRPADLVARLSVLKAALDSHAMLLHGETFAAASRRLPPVVFASVGELLDARLAPRSQAVSS